MRFIGDVVLTTPVIRAIRERYPNAYIAYLAEKEAASLLEHNPYLNEIITFDYSRPTVLEQARVAIRLRRSSFDVFIDLFCNPRTAILSWLSGARMRIGKKVKGRGALYTHKILDNGKPKSAIAYHYQYVKPIGVDAIHWKTEIFLTDDEKREARTYLQWQDIDLSKPIIGIHPGATWPAKMWSWENFADLADLIRAKLHAQVLFVQGPNDRERVEKITRRATGQLLLLPPMKIRQLAAVISCFNAYLTNDNGTMHIAVAVGTKTIGIFGPGEENIWFPYAQPYYEETAGHVALRKDVRCHPCHLDFCNREGEGFMECMNLLSVNEVFDEVKKRLGV
jgi:lipopolysaccharide heptosyltransferase II